MIRAWLPANGARVAACGTALFSALRLVASRAELREYKRIRSLFLAAGRMHGHAKSRELYARGWARVRKFRPEVRLLFLRMWDAGYVLRTLGPPARRPPPNATPRGSYLLP